MFEGLGHPGHHRTDDRVGIAEDLGAVPADHARGVDGENPAAAFVAGRDRAALVDGDHSVRHAREHRLAVVAHVLHVVEELGVLQRDRNLRGERLQALLVFRGERTAAPVQHLGHADDVPVVADHRDAENRTGEEARAAVELRVEPQVGVGVRDVDAHAGGEHRARDAGGLGEPDLPHRVTLGHPGEQLVSALVTQEQRGALGAQHAGGLGHHPLEERVEVELGGDVGDEPEELHLLHPLAVDVLQVSRTHERGRRLRGHRLEQREVVGVEVARRLVEHLRDADHLALAGGDGRAHDVAGRVPGLLVDLAVEPGIGVGVVDDQRLTRREHAPGDAHVVEEADLEQPLALRHPRVQLTRGRVVEEQRAAVGVRLARRHLHERDEHLVERFHRGDGPRHVQQGLRELQPLRLIGDGRTTRLVSRHPAPPNGRAAPR